MLPSISHSATQSLHFATLSLPSIHKINTVHLLMATERHHCCCMVDVGFFSDQLLQLLCPWLLKRLGDSSSHCSYLLGLKTQRKLLRLRSFSHYRKPQDTTYFFQAIILLVSQTFITEICFIYFIKVLPNRGVSLRETLRLSSLFILPHHSPMHKEMISNCFYEHHKFYLRLQWLKSKGRSTHQFCEHEKQQILFRPN